MDAVKAVEYLVQAASQARLTAQEHAQVAQVAKALIEFLVSEDEKKKLSSENTFEVTADTQPSE